MRFIQTKMLRLAALAMLALAPAGPGLAQDAGSKGQNLNGRPVITLSVIGSDCESCYHFTRMFYAEAFARLGYDCRVVTLPSERGLIEANAGRLDGDGSRIGDLNRNNDYPNLIRVEESLGRGRLALYGTDPAISIAGRGDLAGKGYRIGCVRGMKLIETHIAPFVVPGSLVFAENYRQACLMLAAGRVDLVAAIPATIDPLLKRPEFNSAAIRQVGLMESIDFFPYLHKRHAFLAPRLAAVIREMKADGSVARMLQQLGLPPSGHPDS